MYAGSWSQASDVNDLQYEEQGSALTYKQDATERTLRRRGCGTE